MIGSFYQIIDHRTSSGETGHDYSLFVGVTMRGPGVPVSVSRTHLTEGVTLAQGYCRQAATANRRDLVMSGLDWPGLGWRG